MKQVAIERVGPVVLKMLERQHSDHPDVIASDFVLIASDDRTPKLAAISRLSYDAGQARRHEDRAGRRRGRDGQPRAREFEEGAMSQKKIPFVPPLTINSFASHANIEDKDGAFLTVYGINRTHAERRAYHVMRLIDQPAPSEDISGIKESIRRVKAEKARLGAIVAKVFPIGSELNYEKRGHSQLGFVVTHGDTGRLRVQNCRTGKEYWIGMYDVIGIGYVE